MNQLEQLSKMTVVVADSGDIAAIQQLQPTEATTNPSLILQASQQADYQQLILQGIAEPNRALALQTWLQALTPVP